MTEHIAMPERSKTAGLIARSLGACGAALLLVASVMVSPAGAQSEAGTIAEAESLDQLLAATDFRPIDAGPLRLYWAFLDRAPDLGGAKYWIDVSRTGADPDDIAYGFAQSTEFIERYGALDDEAFIDLMYQNMLDREPDVEGRAYWLSLMDDGLAQFEVVRWVVANTEFIERRPFVAGSLELTAVADGPLLGVALGTPGDAAISSLTAALGPPDRDTGWNEGCPLDGGGDNERLVVWGWVSAHFGRDDDGQGQLIAWRVVGDENATNKNVTVTLPGDVLLGAPISEVGTAAGVAPVVDDVFGIVRVDSNPQVFAEGSSFSAPSDDVWVPGALFCD